MRSLLLPLGLLLLLSAATANAPPAAKTTQEEPSSAEILSSPRDHLSLAELRARIHDLEAQATTLSTSDKPAKEGFAKFQSDLWFVVLPIKLFLLVSGLGLLTALGVLAPILRLVVNIIMNVFILINGIFRNAIWPYVYLWCASHTHTHTHTHTYTTHTHTSPDNTTHTHTIPSPTTLCHFSFSHT